MTHKPPCVKCRYLLVGFQEEPCHTCWYHTGGDKSCWTPATDTASLDEYGECLGCARRHVHFSHPPCSLCTHVDNNPGLDLWNPSSKDKAEEAEEAGNCVTCVHRQTHPNSSPCGKCSAINGDMVDSAYEEQQSDGTEDEKNRGWWDGHCSRCYYAKTFSFQPPCRSCLAADRPVHFTPKKGNRTHRAWQVTFPDCGHEEPGKIPKQKEEKDAINTGALPYHLQPGARDPQGNLYGDIRPRQAMMTRFGEISPVIRARQRRGADKEQGTDPVAHPSHYCEPGKPEVWDWYEMGLSEEEFVGAMKANIYKYTQRAGKKDPGKYVQDLEKARAYLDRWIKFARDERLVFTHGAKNPHISTEEEDTDEG